MSDIKIISSSAEVKSTERKDRADSSVGMSETDINMRFNEIYDLTNKPVLAFITSRCANTSDISDIFQDTYMELYQILDKYGVSHIKDGKAYVFKIAKRKIARHYSLWKRLQMFVPLTVQNEEMAEMAERAKSEETELFEAEINSFLTEDFAVNQMILDSAKQFISHKPEDVKKIFYLFYDMDKTIPEIAKILSLSESNVKNKLYRTINELRKLLK